MADIVELTQAALRAAVALSEEIAVQAELKQPGCADFVTKAIGTGGRLVLSIDVSPSPAVELRVVTDEGTHRIGYIPMGASRLTN